MVVDATAWTGEGDFTPLLIDALKGIDAIEFLRVEDAPASRADAGYALISNEIYVKFRLARRLASSRLGGLWRTYDESQEMTLGQLAGQLAGVGGVGNPDYQDEGMLQFLRTEILKAPYQTKGVKVVELVRVYEVGTDLAGAKAPASIEMEPGVFRPRGSLAGAEAPASNGIDLPASIGMEPGVFRPRGGASLLPGCRRTEIPGEQAGWPLE